jgi:hypothetical protein
VALAVGGAGLASRRFRILFPRAPGQRSGLSFTRPLGLFQLSLQSLVPLAQPFLLPLSSQPRSEEGVHTNFSDLAHHYADHYIAKILASTRVIELSQPSATGLQPHVNSGVTAQRDFQHSADSPSRGMLAWHASTPSRSIERRNDFHWGW